MTSSASAGAGLTGVQLPSQGRTSALRLAPPSVGDAESVVGELARTALDTNLVVPAGLGCVRRQSAAAGGASYLSVAQGEYDRARLCWPAQVWEGVQICTRVITYCSPSTTQVCPSPQFGGLAPAVFDFTAVMRCCAVMSASPEVGCLLAVDRASYS